MKNKSIALIAFLFLLLVPTYSFSQSENDAVVIPDNTRFGQRFIPERRSTDRTSAQNGAGAIWFNTQSKSWKGDKGDGTIFDFTKTTGQGSQGPQSPNTVNAGPPSGSSGNPSFRSLVPADIPNIDAAKITTGLLPAVRGGTGLSVFAVGDIFYASTTSNISRLAIGSSGNCLIVSGGLPIWSSSCGSGSGGSGIGTLNGLTASVQTFTNDVNIIISSAGTAHALGWAGQLAISRGGTGAGTSQAAINSLSQLTTAGDLLFHNGTNSTRLARGANNNCLLSTSTTIQWGACPTSTGTVSSVSSGNFSPLFNVSVTNPTTTPTFSFAAISQNQNLVFASPNAASGSPLFRALVPGDIPSLDAAKIATGTFAVGRIPSLNIISTGLTIGRCVRVDNSGFLSAHTADCGTGGGGSGGDVSSNTTTSVAGELAAFADTTGKLIKRSSIVETGSVVTIGNCGTNCSTVDTSLVTGLKTFTLPNLSGTFALTTNNLGVFSSTSSAQLAGVVNDETGGGGVLVFNNQPTILQPTIANLSNMVHTHTNASGGGQLTDASLSAAIGLAKGGTNQTGWTANRCVQVNSAGTALESFSGTCGSGGVGSPGGADKTIQFNDSGTLNGGPLYNASTQVMTIGNAVNAAKTPDVGIRRCGPSCLRIGDGGTGDGIIQMRSLKSTTGTRYVCIDSTGNLTSSASACSGT